MALNLEHLNQAQINEQFGLLINSAEGSGCYVWMGVTLMQNRLNRTRLGLFFVEDDLGRETEVKNAIHEPLELLIKACEPDLEVDFSSLEPKGIVGAKRSRLLLTTALRKMGGHLIYERYLVEE